MANEFNIQLDPSSQSGLDLFVYVKNTNGSQAAEPISLTEVDTTGFYTADLNQELNPGVYIVSFNNTDDSSLMGIGELYWTGTKELTLLDLDLIRKALLNNMKIDTDANQLLIYEDDGETVLEAFDLFDGDGEPTSSNVFEIRENA